MLALFNTGVVTQCWIEKKKKVYTHPPLPLSSLSWVCTMRSPRPLSHAITMATAHSRLYPSRHVSHSNECWETQQERQFSRPIDWWFVFMFLYMTRATYVRTIQNSTKIQYTLVNSLAVEGSLVREKSTYHKNIKFDLQMCTVQCNGYLLPAVLTVQLYLVHQGNHFVGGEKV